MNHAPHPDCPEEQLLQQLAAGICSRETALTTIQHAAQCDHCGPLLNQYLEEFSVDLHPEDQTLLNNLATGRPEWQERFVREHGLGSPERPARRSLFERLWPKTTGWWPKMVLAGGLAVLLVAIPAGPGLWARFELYRADRMIAAAYAERRPTEMRLTNVPYAAYSEMPVERGGDGDQDLGYDRPALSDANALVGRKLKSGKLDPNWLQIQGRVSLFQGTARSLADAETTLEKARSKGADNPGTQIDLAATYFERDSKAKLPNLQRTLNLLNEVLHNPKLGSQDRSVALFDLAIAYEKTQAWDMAVPVWEQYLKLDPSSPWAKEAEMHLKEAKSKLRPPREQGYDRPSFFLSHVAGRSLPVEAEEYQNIALELWLPRAVEDPKGDSYKAVAALSDVLEQHSDPWLRDLLASLRPGDLAAIRALSAAILANEEDLHDQALDQARAAAHIFAQQHNTPGELRARIEEVYALRRSSRASDCLQHSVSLGNRLFGTGYRWLQAQLFLEKASCRNSSGELQEATADLAQGLTIAEDSRFPVLVLRNIQLSAGIKRQQHKYDEAWKEAVVGLDYYWRGMYPPVRLEQLYAVMWQCARDSDSLYTAAALLQHTLKMRNDPAGGIRKDRSLEAHLHSRLANILTTFKEDNLAKEEEHKAFLLTKDLADYAGNFNLLTKIEAADLHLAQGDSEFALSTLIPVGELLKTAQDNYISLNYFRVLGDTYLRLKQLNQASSAYQSAIQIADSTLYSLKDSGRRMQWMKATDESYRGMVRVLLEEKKDDQALQFWERYKGRPLAGESHSGGFEETAAVPQARIRWRTDSPRPSRQETRLIYATFEDGLQVWTTGSKNVQSKWIKIKQEDLAHDIRDFVAKCAASGSDLAELQVQGKKLFSILLQPIILQLSESSPVIVELDRPAYGLPIEALMSPEGWYFGGRYSVVYSPGMMMERNIRMPGEIGLQEPLLLVDASQTDSSSYLPGDELERKTIARTFPNSKIMDSNHANWTQVAGALSQSHIFHFMGHGKPDRTGAYLVLSKSSSLKATDFSPELLKSSRLAVLSACSTGVGGEDGLLDTGNLVHSFLAAGVPSVIASRWNVDSENTAKLMSSFYLHLGKNETVAQSISEARREILATRQHPYYWASFNLSGRTN
ncbi:MAG TPA: CHAT domain-containing protein [Candidatus Solibacter sp.]|nr:CHAT domain-containing protein [Candidatus Solibacter sp.]